MVTPLVDAASEPSATRISVVSDDARFEGEFRLVGEEARLAVGVGERLLVSADEAVLTVRWTQSVTDPSRKTEVVLARGAMEMRYSPARFVVDVDASDGFAVAAAREASTRATRFSVDAQEALVPLRLRAGGDEALHFDASVPPGMLRLAHVDGLASDDVVVYAVGASITGDARHRVGVTEEPYGAGFIVNASFAEVRLTRGAVEGAAGGAQAFAAAALVEGTGTASWLGSRGTVDAPLGAVDVRRSIDAVGSITARVRGSPMEEGLAGLGSPPPEPPVWSASGEFSRLVVDGRAVGGPPAAAVVGGAALLWVVYALYSRIPDGAVLRHPARRRLHELLLQRPGLSMQEARQASGLSWGTFRYHVRILEGRYLVRRVRSARRVLLAPASGEPLPSALLRGRGRAAAVLGFVAERGDGASALDAARGLGLDHQLVYHHLKTLRALGLVEADPGSRPARYRVRSAGPRRDVAAGVRHG